MLHFDALMLHNVIHREFQSAHQGPSGCSLSQLGAVWSQILDLRTESPEVLQALTTLSTFYDSNTPSDRRQLRATIERRGVSINQEYLSAAEQVIQASILHHINHSGCHSFNVSPCEWIHAFRHLKPYSGTQRG